MIQVIWDIYIRDPKVFMQKSKEILGSHAEKWMPKPMREIDTRWGSNGRACENIIEGLYITNEDGHCFWVLLFKELASYYNDWRVGRLDALISMFMMEELQVNCAFELESGMFFEIHYKFHGNNGELSSKSGLRTLDLFSELFDHAFPYVKKMMADPESMFPQAFRLLETFQKRADVAEEEGDLRERDRILGIIRMKKEQLELAIIEMHDELAKLEEDMFSPAQCILAISHPRHGAGAMRAILETCKNGGLDIDHVFEYDAPNAHMIDENLTWGFLEEENKTEFERGLFDKLVGKEDKMIKFFRFYGFMQCKCRNELKMLTHERGTPRPIESSTRLMDFLGVHPELFDLLWSRFAYTLSASRVIEGAHGFQRESWNSQASFWRNDSQLRYMMDTVHRFRKARRTKVYLAEGRDEEEDKCERRGCVKHHDRKFTCQMGGEQLHRFSLTYSEKELSQRIPLEIRKEYSITNVNSVGLLRMDKDYTQKRMDLLAKKQQKNLSNERRKIMTLEEHREQAKSWQTRHDAAWNTREQQEALVKISKLSTKAAWGRIPAAMLEDEVKAVLPAFWVLYKKTITKFTKSHLLRAAKDGDTWKNHLGKFILHAIAISDGKEKNNISTKHRAKQLETAKATKCDLLSEFILADKSEWLSTLAEGEKDKLDLMRSIISSAGTEIPNQKRWKAKTVAVSEVTIDFQLTRAVDPEHSDVDDL